MSKRRKIDNYMVGPTPTHVVLTRGRFGLQRETRGVSSVWSEQGKNTFPPNHLSPPGCFRDIARASVRIRDAPRSTSIQLLDR